MNHQWQCQLPGGTDMGAKTLALPSHVGNTALAQTKVIKTGFPDPDHSWQAPQRQEVLQAGLLDALVVRMHPERGPKISVISGQTVNRGKFFERGANAQGPIHL